MGKTAESAATVDAAGLRLALVAARYNEVIVEQLIAGARAAWMAAGGEARSLRLERVPGAFEIPLAAQVIAQRGGVDAVVALGCVIRGATTHYELVAGECARGLQQVMLSTGVPVSFGVLTTETSAQAEERALPGPLNKGGEALLTAVAMVRLLRAL